MKTQTLRGPVLGLTLASVLVVTSARDLHCRNEGLATLGCSCSHSEVTCRGLGLEVVPDDLGKLTSEVAMNYTTV